MFFNNLLGLLAYDIDTYGAGNIQFFTGNNAVSIPSTERMRITYDGRVGIGTTGPGVKLDIVGRTRTTELQLGSSATAGYVLTTDASGVGTWQALPSGIGGSGTANYIPKFTAPSDIGNSVIYENLGNVGIGTTGTGKKLDVSGTFQASTYSTNFIRLNQYSGDHDGSYDVELGGGPDAVRIYRDNVNLVSFGEFGKSVVFRAYNTDDGFYWYTAGGANAMFIHPNTGRVGIGTTSPQGALDVSSTTGAFIVPRMTTAQRDALTAINGMIIYNITTNQFNFYENGAWVTK